MNAGHLRSVPCSAVVFSAVVSVTAPAAAQELPNFANFANWSDLKCYQPDAKQDLSSVPPIKITQLNPLFQAPNHVIPDHTIQLRDLQQLCVPVQKNEGKPSTDAAPFLRYFDLACYNVKVVEGSPALPPLVLQHRNPVLIGTPTAPGLLSAALQREAVGFSTPPPQLCVPVAKNERDFPIPPEVRALVQYLDFECFNISPNTQTPALNTNLLLRHLNPALAKQPVENVVVTKPQSLCVPVAKNNAKIPPEVLRIISRLDLKKYDLASNTGGALPPIDAPLQLSQLNPLLTNVAPVDLKTLTPKQIMLPVAKCNPFQSTVRTVIPPDNFFAGPLYFNLQSNCPGSPHLCGGSVVLPANTTITSKCNLLVGAINATCGGSGFTATTPDACATGSFTVVDNTCNASSPPVGSGLSIGLSNDNTVFTQETSSGTLPDYEQDLITPGCGGQDSDHLNIVKGNPTGVPFISGSTASVVFAVDPTALGGAPVTVTVPTRGQSLNSVVSAGVALLNRQLQGQGGTSGGTGVSCVQDSAHPRALHCSQPSGEPIPAGIQINDTGLTRGSLAGSASILRSLTECIDTGRCPKFTSASGLGN